MTAIFDWRELENSLMKLVKKKRKKNATRTCTFIIIVAIPLNTHIYTAFLSIIFIMMMKKCTHSIERII